MSNESETKRRKHTIAQMMQLHRLGLLLSSSCIAVMSWAAVVSCVVVVVIRTVVTVLCVVNVVEERERADVAHQQTRIFQIFSHSEP